MSHGYFWYTAKKGNQTAIEVRTESIMTSRIPHDKEQCLEWCKACGKFGAGGCNPHSPDFKKLKKGFNKAIIINLMLRVDEVPEVVAKCNRYIITQFIDRLLANFSTQIGWGLKETAFERLPSQFLATGYCKGCLGCKFPDTLVCVNPRRRTFSMESTGIHVLDMVKDVFGFELQWYKKDGVVPEYLTKTFALLINDSDTDLEDLEKEAFNYIVGMLKEKAKDGVEGATHKRKHVERPILPVVGKPKKRPRS